MKRFKDIHNRQIRLTGERQEHIEAGHTEMYRPLEKSKKLYQNLIKVSLRTDPDVKLFYRHYDITPVTEKYLCVVVKY